MPWKENDRKEFQKALEEYSVFIGGIKFEELVRNEDSYSERIIGQLEQALKNITKELDKTKTCKIVVPAGTPDGHLGTERDCKLYNYLSTWRLSVGDNTRELIKLINNIVEYKNADSRELEIKRRIDEISKELSEIFSEVQSEVSKARDEMDKDMKKGVSIADAFKKFNDRVEAKQKELAALETGLRREKEKLETELRKPRVDVGVYKTKLEKEVKGGKMLIDHFKEALENVKSLVDK